MREWRYGQKEAERQRRTEKDRKRQRQRQREERREKRDRERREKRDRERREKRDRKKPHQTRMTGQLLTNFFGDEWQTLEKTRSNSKSNKIKARQYYGSYPMEKGIKISMI